VNQRARFASPLVKNSTAARFRDRSTIFGNVDHDQPAAVHQQCRPTVAVA